MSEILEFKCPCCGGKLEFNAATQNMKCPYCDSEIDVSSLAANDAVLDAEPVDQQQSEGWSAEETEGMSVYQCKSCGGEIVAEETTGAAHCPYCGNPVVMTSKFSGELKPDYIIPFSITKEQAIEALKKHYSGKKLLPKIFSSENHLNEIKGVYVPFWLFDAEAKSDIDFTMDSVKTWSDNKNNYCETSRYSALRSGTVKFSNVPVDAATKISDDMMESIEPFDSSKAVKFSTAYLSGYLADRYSVPAEESVERAKERMNASIISAYAETVSGFSNVQLGNNSTDINSIKAKYALYPVWLLTTAFNGKQYLFAVNGQTGKIVGDLPIDEAYAKKLKLIYALAAGAAAYAVGILILLAGGML